MTRTKVKFCIAIAILAIAGIKSTVSANTVEFQTITEALNYSGNKSTVTKLVITGEISGNDYSENSDWSRLKTLNEPYPALETIEILTSQDIPDGTTSNCLFGGHPNGNKWLKHFSAPNVTVIGHNAFHACTNLTTLHFPNAVTIGNNAFVDCISLTTVEFPSVVTIGPAVFFYCFALETVNFPNVTHIHQAVFQECYNLTSLDFPKVIHLGNGALNLHSSHAPNLSFIRLGTDFEAETEIVFGGWVFGNVWNDFSFTQNVDLILGKNVALVIYY